MTVTGASAVMFLLADPVAQVRGTDATNRYFASVGRDVASVPLHVRADQLAQVVSTIRLLANVAGFGVTVPHKRAIAPLLDRRTARAEQAGAVNWVRRDADGTLVGDNLDGAGFVAGLTARGIDVRHARVLQVGAGGVGTAIATSLAGAGAEEITLHNRTAAVAEELAERLAGVYPGCALRVGAPDPRGYDIVVNATSVGMSGDGGTPLPVDRLTAGQVVADVVMVPETTPLLAAAAEAGCVVVRGREMLEPQFGLLAEFLGWSPDPLV